MFVLLLMKFATFLLATSRGGLGRLFVNQIQVDWAKCPVVRIPA